MSSQAPAPYGIGPPAPVQQQQQAPYTAPYPQPQPSPPPRPPSSPSKGPVIGMCSACESAIHEGEEVLELFPGIARVSGQTGQMLADAYPNEPAQSYTVHDSCAMDKLGEIYPDNIDEMFYEMASEMANEQMDEFLSDRGLDFDTLCDLLDKAGFKSSNEEYRDRVDGSG